MKAKEEQNGLFFSYKRFSGRKMRREKEKEMKKNVQCW